MTWFKRRRDYDPTEPTTLPQPCHVCGARIGTLQMMVPADPKTKDASGPSRRWICASCLDTLRRTSADN